MVSRESRLDVLRRGQNRGGGFQTSPQKREKELRSVEIVAREDLLSGTSRRGRG